MQRLEGLIAATYTPMDREGRFNSAPVAPLVEYLIGSGVSGLYVCGSTGEGMSLASEERRAVLESFVTANAGRVPLIAQVGHNSLDEARQLAAHAANCGADAISATCPSYFKVADVATLVACMAHVTSAAPETPFYYYHIPALTGSTLNVVEFLERGSHSIPSLAGLKYTDTKLHEFQQCREFGEERFDVVWGCDEMLLGALATGARAAIGSTYNIASPLYRRMISAFESGRIDEARRLQSLSVNMISTMMRYPFHPAMKAVLGMLGLDVGTCRLPQGQLTDEQTQALRSDLEALGFFEWSQAK